MDDRTLERRLKAKDEQIAELKVESAAMLEACITAYEHIGGVYHRHNLAMARLSKVIRKHKGE